MVKTWHEIGGREQTEEERRVEEKKEKEVREGKAQSIEELEERRKEKVKTGLVVEVGGKWKEFGKVKSREIYNKLVEIRIKESKQEMDVMKWRAFYKLEQIKKSLTAKERDFWWRLKHQIISIRKTESKWKRDNAGRVVSPVCPVCKETWRHYERDCKALQEFKGRVGEEMKDWFWLGRDRQRKITEEEWRLEEEGMGEREAMIIAKARWIYHCERCMIDMKKKRRIDQNQMIDKLRGLIPPIYRREDY